MGVLIDGRKVGGRLTQGDADVLHRTASEIEPKVLLEIGSADGGSTMVLGDVAKSCGGHLYCVEPKPTGRWKGNVAEAGLTEHVTMIAGESPWINPGHLPDLIDYLFIDGDHRLRWILADYHYWSRFLRVGGRVAFHDFTGPLGMNGEWVKQAIALIREDDGLQEVGRYEQKSYGTIVFEKRAGPEPWPAKQRGPSKEPFHKFGTGPERTVRCMPTLKCKSMCLFCSAGMHTVPGPRRALELAPQVWAEGINRRNRHTILTGGEPLEYRRFVDLVNLIRPRLSVYTSLDFHADEGRIDRIVEEVTRPVDWLVSLHPNVDRHLWLHNVKVLLAAGQGVRVHVIKAGDWQGLKDFFFNSGLPAHVKLTVCSDQASGIRSQGDAVNAQHPRVRCKSSIFVYGPEGRRYQCVHDLMLGRNPAESIVALDGPDWLETSQCERFGYCTPCDNRLVSEVWDVA